MFETVFKLQSTCFNKVSLNNPFNLFLPWLQYCLCVFYRHLCYNIRHNLNTKHTVGFLEITSSNSRNKALVSKEVHFKRPDHFLNFNFFKFENYQTSIIIFKNNTKFSTLHACLGFNLVLKYINL